MTYDELTRQAYGVKVRRMPTDPATAVIDWILQRGFPAAVLFALIIVFGLYVKSQNDRIARLEKQVDELLAQLARKTDASP